MLQTTAAPSIMPSSARPVPLRVRPDLITESMFFRGVPFVVIKDPIALKYHRLRPEQWRVLESLDGSKSLEDLRDMMSREYPGIHWTPKGLQQLINDLHEKRLLFSDRLGQEHGVARQRKKNKKKKLLNVFKNFLFLRLPGWDPAGALRFLYPYTSWLFSKPVVICAILAILGSLGFLSIHFDEFSAALPEFQQFFGWPNLMWLWLVIAVTKIIHEFGHGLCCHHFGAECHEMGVMLLVFSPTLYCDVSDSWMLKRKWPRIFIGAGGMYFEAFLSVMALWVWWNTQNGIVHHLALNVFFITTISSVIFNLNPLMRLDGYYMLSDWLEIPNLRQRADKLLLETFGKQCLGIDPPPDPFEPDSGRAWFVTYSLCAAAYKYFIVIAISLFLYTVLKPYRLQSLGMAVAMMSLVGLLVRPIMGVTKMLRQPRDKPLSKPRMITTGLVTLALVAMVTQIPVPTIVSAAFYLEPRDVNQVYNLTPGRLVGIERHAGDVVQKGDVLIVLENPDLDLERERLIARLELAEEQERLYKVQRDSPRRLLARETIDSLNKQVVDLDDRIAKLTVRAPIAGKVVAPPRLPAPSVEQKEDQLPRWHGVPLDERNIGAVLEPRTHIASIAPLNKTGEARSMDAILLIDQADRRDVAVGDRLGIKFDHLPDQRFDGVIAEFSQRQQDEAPEALTNKMGGSLPTVTDGQGREKLTSVAYQATVPLEDDDGLLLPGLRGRARVLVQERPLGSVAWNYLRRTFLFRL